MRVLTLSLAPSRRGPLDSADHIGIAILALRQRSGPTSESPQHRFARHPLCESSAGLPLGVRQAPTPGSVALARPGEHAASIGAGAGPRQRSDTSVNPLPPAS